LEFKKINYFSNKMHVLQIKNVPVPAKFTSTGTGKVPLLANFIGTGTYIKVSTNTGIGTKVITDYKNN
jgi:hypothetical protein